MDFYNNNYMYFITILTLMIILVITIVLLIKTLIKSRDFGNDYILTKLKSAKDTYENNKYYKGINGSTIENNTLFLRTNIGEEACYDLDEIDEINLFEKNIIGATRYAHRTIGHEYYASIRTNTENEFRHFCMGVFSVTIPTSITYETQVLVYLVDCIKNRNLQAISNFTVTDIKQLREKYLIKNINEIEIFYNVVRSEIEKKLDKNEKDS